MTTEGTAAEFLFLEASHLDERRWDEWLTLYWPDAHFWMPAWKGEHELTDDPETELSLIFASCAALAERIARVRSSRSVASIPLPRTQHAITNIVAEHDGPNRARVSSNWTVHQFRTKSREVEVFFGRYEHELERRDGRWGIRRKKIVLLNDYMPATVDFYNV